jgi:hypothetical protein
MALCSTDLRLLRSLSALDRFGDFASQLRNELPVLRNSEQLLRTSEPFQSGKRNLGQGVVLADIAEPVIDSEQARQNGRLAGKSAQEVIHINGQALFRSHSVILNAVCKKSPALRRAKVRNCNFVRSFRRDSP